jgi:hypothetical protein
MPSYYELETATSPRILHTYPVSFMPMAGTARPLKQKLLSPVLLVRHDSGARHGAGSDGAGLRTGLYTPYQAVERGCGFVRTTALRVLTPPRVKCSWQKGRADERVMPEGERRPMTDRAPWRPM